MGWGSPSGPDWADGWRAASTGTSPWLPFVITGFVYLAFLALSGEWRTLLFRLRDLRPAWEMQLYYLGVRTEHPPQGKHNALQKLAYTSIVLLCSPTTASGFAIYKPVQLAWLTALFGGYELARYWHFVTVWLFVGFTLVHVALVFVVDPASLRAMTTGWYRGKFPSHD
jgi:thiosulfate reductase cytochrome b subunit